MVEGVEFYLPWSMLNCLQQRAKGRLALPLVVKFLVEIGGISGPAGYASRNSSRRLIQCQLKASRQGSSGFDPLRLGHAGLCCE